MLSKFLENVKAHQSEIVLSSAVILVSVISFQVGKFSVSRQLQTPIEIKDTGAATITNKKLITGKSAGNTKTANASNFQVVASKNSDKYHFLWCPGASKISEANKIYFSSEEEAKSRGYTLAGNCKK